MAAPADWPEAIQVFEQLVQECRTANQEAHLALTRDLAHARDSLHTIRLDAIETNRAPFSPKESCAAQLAVEVVLAALPGSAIVTFAATRALTLAGFLVRASGRTPLNRVVAAEVALGTEWSLKKAAAQLPALLLDPMQGAKGLARDAGKDVTKTVFGSIVTEAVSRVSPQERAPTGLLAVEFFRRMHEQVDRFLLLNTAQLDTMDELARDLARTYDKHSEAALRNALLALCQPAQLGRADASGLTSARAALAQFRAQRAAPVKFAVPNIPLGQDLEVGLGDLARWLGSGKWGSQRSSSRFPSP